MIAKFNAAKKQDQESRKHILPAALVEVCVPTLQEIHTIFQDLFRRIEKRDFDVVKILIDYIMTCQNSNIQNRCVDLLMLYIITRASEINGYIPVLEDVLHILDTTCTSHAATQSVSSGGEHFLRQSLLPMCKLYQDDENAFGVLLEKLRKMFDIFESKDLKLSLHLRGFLEKVIIHKEWKDVSNFSFSRSLTRRKRELQNSDQKSPILDEKNKEKIDKRNAPFTESDPESYRKDLKDLVYAELKKSRAYIVGDSGSGKTR